MQRCESDRKSAARCANDRPGSGSDQETAAAAAKASGNTANRHNLSAAAAAAASQHPSGCCWMRRKARWPRADGEIAKFYRCRVTRQRDMNRVVADGG
jgi:hypothetical protein